MNGRALLARVLIILLFLGCTGIGLAHAQPTPPAPADPGQAAPPGPEAQAPGQLMVRVLLPPGIPAAVLSLNGAYAAPLPGGVLAAPLVLLPGGYYAQISAPGARSYEAPFQVAPGQLVELNGVLQPETGVAPPYVGVTPSRAPSPFSPRTPVTARRVGRKIVLGVVLGVLGVALTAGILTAAICGAGKCHNASDHHD